jgi:hypothetical protein
MKLILSGLVIFEVFTVVEMWIMVFWILTLYCFVGGYNVSEKHIARIFRIDNFNKTTPRHNT